MAFKHFWVQYKLGKISDQAYIKAESFVIGRAPDCDLPIPTDILSRRHIKVYLEEETIFIKDLGSTNGTYLQGERLVPHQKYEYVTGNRLYLDAGKECTLRITPIYQRDLVDLEIEQRGLELEKKKHELRSKGKISRGLKEIEARENFVANASSSVDNIFENLIYIAKSARFNKEKKIKEAENISQDMIEKAQREMETQRALLEKELKSLQVQTKKEANRILKSANEKAAQHMKKAEDKAKRLKAEANEGKEKVISAAEARRQEIIDDAQLKHGEIIADAHIKNKELKEESERIESGLGARREEMENLESEISDLKKTAKEQKELTTEARENYSHELSELNSLKAKVLNMEKRNAAALDVLESKIPNLEKKAAGLDQKVFDNNIELKKKETEIEKLERTIGDLHADLMKNEEKSAASERRLDELNDKIIEAEDNLFRLNKIKQQRNEEIDREVAERREKQKASEEKTAEKIARRREKADREIEVNLTNAKERALSIVEEAQKEAEGLLAKATAEAEESLVDIKEESKRIKEEADTYNIEKRRAAENYHSDKLDEADKEAQKIIAQAKLTETNLRFKTEEDLKEAKEESKRLRTEAREYNQSVREEADEYSMDTRNDADDYSHKIREEADIEVSSRRKNFEFEIQEAKDKLLADSRKEAKNIKEKSRKAAEEIIQKAKDEAAILISKTQSQSERELDDLKKQIEKRQKETDEEINDLRAHAVQKMEEQRRQFEKEELERNRIRVLKIRKDLNEVLRARIVPFLKDQSQVEKISQMMTKSVNAILLDEVDDEIFDAENYSDIDPTLQQKRVMKFYLAAGAGALALVLLLIFAPTIEKMAKDSGRDIANQIEEEDKKQIEATQKANDLSAEFKPEMVGTYLPTYTERVMYMENYLTLENDIGFKGQWHLELEEFFVDKLRLTENDMVPFVAREAALLKELGEARNNINGNFVEEGKKRLQEIEADFFRRLKQGGLKQKQLDRIMKFKKKFFKENKTIFSG